MFINNKYTNWYHAIMKRAAIRDLTPPYDRHHIIPKSLGGSKAPNNIAQLTMRAHFVCHQLLVRMLTGISRYKMLHAVWRLAHVKGQRITSRLYEKLRIERSLAMTGRKNPKVSAALKGRKKTAEEIAKRVATVTGVKRPATSAALKGRKNPKVSAALKGRTQPRDLVEKRAAALRGKPSGTLGRKQSAEEKLLRSNIMKGRSSSNKGGTWSESRRSAYEKNLKDNNAS